MKRYCFIFALFAMVLNLQAQDQHGELLERIEYLISLKDYERAKLEIDRFKNTHVEQTNALDQEKNVALNVIEKQIIQFLIEEENTFLKVKSVRELTLCDAYLIDFPFGKNRNQVLKIQNELNEEAEQRAYQKIKNGTSVDDCKEYLIRYPNGRFRMEVTKLLNDRIETNLYLKAKTENEITAYEDYVNKYPKGKYSEEVNRIIANSYLDFGEKDLKKRRYTDAINQYERYLKRFPNGPGAELAKANIKKAERLKLKLGVDFLGFYADKSTPFGLYFGYVNRRSLSYYANLSFNLDFIELTRVDNTINNQGISINTSGFPKAVEPAKIKIGNVGFSNGIAFPIFYPFWGYVGGGVSYIPYMQQYDVFAENGVLIDTKYLRNTDETKLLWFPEAGIKLKVAKLVVLRYGVRYYQNQPLLHQFGLGIQLEQ